MTKSSTRIRALLAGPSNELGVDHYVGLLSILRSGGMLEIQNPKNKKYRGTLPALECVAENKVSAMKVLAATAPSKLSLLGCFLWLWIHDLPVFWLRVAAKKHFGWRITELNDTIPLKKLALFLGVPAPPGRLGKVSLMELAYASKVMSTKKRRLIKAAIHPSLWESAAKFEEAAGPVLSEVARAAHFKVSKAFGVKDVRAPV